jgi:hypothetical protein
MSENDRVRVPTNGHRAPLAVDGSAAGAPMPDAPEGAVRPADPRIAFSPGQVAAGFGILAGIILLIVGSRRRGQRD